MFTICFKIPAAGMHRQAIRDYGFGIIQHSSPIRWCGSGRRFPFAQSSHKIFDSKLTSNANCVILHQSMRKEKRCMFLCQYNGIEQMSITVSSFLFSDI